MQMKRGESRALPMDPNPLRVQDPNPHNNGCRAEETHWHRRSVTRGKGEKAALLRGDPSGCSCHFWSGLGCLFIPLSFYHRGKNKEEQVVQDC